MFKMVKQFEYALPLQNVTNLQMRSMAHYISQNPGQHSVHIGKLRNACATQIDKQQKKRSAPKLKLPEFSREWQCLSNKVF